MSSTSVSSRPHNPMPCCLTCDAPNMPHLYLTYRSQVKTDSVGPPGFCLSPCAPAQVRHCWHPVSVQVMFSKPVPRSLGRNHSPMPVDTASSSVDCNSVWTAHHVMHWTCGDCVLPHLLWLQGITGAASALTAPASLWSLPTSSSWWER